MKRETPLLAISSRFLANLSQFLADRLPLLADFSRFGPTVADLADFGKGSKVLEFFDKIRLEN